MKKYIALIVLLAACATVKAGTVSVVCLSTNATKAARSNLLALTTGPVRVNSITIQANEATNAIVNFMDSTGGGLTIVNPAYTNTSYYVTNYMGVTSNLLYTNFFGHVDNLTNTMLVTYNTAVNASTTWCPIVWTATAPASGVTVYSGVDLYFNRGIWVTNIGLGHATITINYTQ